MRRPRSVSLPAPLLLSKALCPSAWEFVCLSGLALAFAFPDLFEADDRFLWVNAIGAGAYAVTLAFGAWRMVTASRYAVMTPLFAFRCACVVYFGLGSLSPFIVDDRTLDYMMNVGTFSGRDLAKFNLVVMLCTLIVLAAARIVCAGARVSAMMGRFTQEKAKSEGAVVLGVLMYLVGAAVQYLVVVPDQLRLFQSPLPYAFGQLANCLYVGVFLLTFAALDRRQIAVVAPFALALFDAAVGALLFSKTAVLLPMLAFCLACMARSQTRLGLVLPLFLVVASFLLSAPLVSYGRSQLGLADGAPARERIEILEQYLLEGDQPQRHAINYSWVRLSYVNWGVRVIQLQDQGEAGSTLSQSWAAFIPRALWPDKPDMSVVGTNLYSAVTGLSGVSVSPGLFAESYWNFGWLGPPLLMTPLGVLLGYLSRLSMFVMRQRLWILLPSVFLGVRLGSRVDGHYVMDVVGAGVIIGCLTAILAGAHVILRGVNDKRPTHKPSRSRISASA